MKILFLSQEYPPQTGWGGIGTYVATIGPALTPRGHEVCLLSCVHNQGHADYALRLLHFVPKQRVTGSVLIWAIIYLTNPRELRYEPPSHLNPREDGERNAAI